MNWHLFNYFWLYCIFVKVGKVLFGTPYLYYLVFRLLLMCIISLGLLKLSGAILFACLLIILGRHIYNHFTNLVSALGNFCLKSDGFPFHDSSSLTECVLWKCQEWNYLGQVAWLSHIFSSFILALLITLEVKD